jgi:hypothetical protein
VRDCRQLPDSVWAARVSFLVYVAPDHGTGCGIWRRVDGSAYVLLSQINRLTHCVHLCDAGCVAHIGSNLVIGKKAFGLTGHHAGQNPLYLLNENFLR